VDRNDHAPEFPQRRLRQRIAESMDPQSGGIAVPPAVDPDAGPNAIHKYEIYSTTDQFILDVRQTADGGTDLRLLLRQPLDREHEDRFDMCKLLSKLQHTLLGMFRSIMAAETANLSL